MSEKPSATSGPAGDPEAPYVRLAAVGLTQRTDGRWLLLHRTEPWDGWDPPGGRMERGEDLFRAVVREVSEEAGLQVEVAGPCYAHLAWYKGERLLAVTMACRPLGDPERVVLEEGGFVGWRWATVDEWLALVAEGSTSWTAANIAKATGAALALWIAEEA